MNKSKLNLNNYITRIAPTPSGFLHLGNLFNFALTYAITKSLNGTVNLRIDNLDIKRVRKEYVQDIFAKLQLLEVFPDNLIHDTDEYLQISQKNLNMYKDYLKMIPSNLIFVCACTRSDLKKHSQYPGTCINKNLKYIPNKNSIKTLPNDENREPIVLWTKENVPSYQLQSIVDDIEAGTNLIIRGQDLRSSTLAQKHIAKLLGNNSFENIKFIHHKLLTNNGIKISKSTLANNSPLNIDKLEFFNKFSSFFNLKRNLNSMKECISYFQDYPEFFEAHLD